MKVLARLPQDVGKRVWLDRTSVEVVSEQRCEFCELAAVALVEGDRDSQGREVVYLCARCMKKWS